MGKERITKILTAEDRIQLQLLTKGERKKRQSSPRRNRDGNRNKTWLDADKVPEIRLDEKL